MKGSPVFVAGLGDPAWVVPEAHAKGTKMMGLAGSVRNAERQKAAGVDVVIAQVTRPVDTPAKLPISR